MLITPVFDRGKILIFPDIKSANRGYSPDILTFSFATLEDNIE
jgi:hypothetical protein